MVGISEKEVGGVLTVALAANLALNGHLIAKLVHVGVISAEHAAEIFAKTADSIERPLGVLRDEERPQRSCANMRRAFEKWPRTTRQVGSTAMSPRSCCA
jgi:hypothetical protein